MTTGKAGGLLGERLKGANKTMSRPRRLHTTPPTLTPKGCENLCEAKWGTKALQSLQQLETRPQQRSNLFESPGIAGGLPN